ncbi:MAG TPA: ABC transporter ATP-binding protein [Burkholderiales bacterium]|jgi:ABC-type sugar transport system ATPase subunit|nr:ABC transporter ATP-binding protein [Burkholderiales bacterium]
MTAARVQLSGIVKRHGAVTALAGIDLEIQAGEFFSLLGPSGSGKTTTLRILAGLEAADAGTVHVNGEDVTLLEPGARDVAMVFQSYALYPHMTVGENIAFPLRMSGVAPQEISRSVKEAAEKVRIAHLLERKPGQLSGGQQQRCALARAIVRKPALFLLDEPLSNLDAKLRIETRVELKRLQRALNVTAVYVTHDQEEALSLSDRLAVFMDGRIVQMGTPEEVFSRPATVAVAGFLGNPPMNLLPARLDEGVAKVESFSFPVPTLKHLGTKDVVLGIRPSGVRLSQDGLPATVAMSEALGEEFYADVAVGELLVRARVKERPAERAQVRLQLDEAGLHVFDRASGLRL